MMTAQLTGPIMLLNMHWFWVQLPAAKCWW